MEIVLNVFMSLVSLALIGLMVTNPRLISKAYYGLSDGLNSWFEKAFSRTADRFPPHDKMIPDVIPEELEPIDYKKLEADNLKSMKDSWDERFLSLHKLSDLTDDQLAQLSRYKAGTDEKIKQERQKRFNAQREAEREAIKNLPPDIRRMVWDGFHEDAFLCNPCGRGKCPQCRGCDCDH
jgi:hypothetical protein